MWTITEEIDGLSSPFPMFSLYEGNLLIAQCRDPYMEENYYQRVLASARLLVEKANQQLAREHGENVRPVADTDTMTKAERDAYLADDAKWFSRELVVLLCADLDTAEIELATLSNIVTEYQRRALTLEEKENPTS